MSVFIPFVYKCTGFIVLHTYIHTQQNSGFDCHTCHSITPLDQRSAGLYELALLYK